MGSFMKEFKEFAMKGNVMDLAIGIRLEDPCVIRLDAGALNGTNLAQDPETIQIRAGLCQTAVERTLVLIIELIQLTIASRTLAEGRERNLHEPAPLLRVAGDVENLRVTELLGEREGFPKCGEVDHLVLNERETDTSALTKTRHLGVLDSVREGHAAVGVGTNLILLAEVDLLTVHGDCLA